MLVKIKCLKCGTEGSISLAQPTYHGPYRCWKCKELFNIRIENHALKSCEPLSQEEYLKFQEMEALRAKFRGSGGG